MDHVPRMCREGLFFVEKGALHLLSAPKSTEGRSTTSGSSTRWASGTQVSTVRLTAALRRQSEHPTTAKAGARLGRLAAFSPSLLGAPAFPESGSG